MEDWRGLEVELIIADYFEMLLAELSGKNYNKSEHRNRLKALLNNRSDGSIEFKHQNISAVMINNGLPYVKGYKPRWNYQQLLEDKALNYVKGHGGVEKDFDDFANRKIETEPKQIQFENWSVAPPEPAILNEPTVIYNRRIKRNYLELEQKNRSVGNTGEELVFEYEKWRLDNAGQSGLARQVRWVSKEEGDGAGFDIFSKKLNGTDIFIEVKTTTLGKSTPIFFSKTENDFSREKKDAFYLYRVFDLKDEPKMFQRNGKFEDICNFEAINFRGFF